MNWNPPIDDTPQLKPGPALRPGFWPEVIGALGAMALAMMAVWLGLGTPSHDALEFRPTPDAAEYAWVARQFARGQSPLLPIVNDLYPSRYSPIHPWLMSQWIRLHGGRAKAMFSWPPAAFLAGLGVLYLWLAIARLSPLSRLVILALILISPQTWRICAELLQEPTLLLLFWITITGWHCATAATLLPSHRYPTITHQIGASVAGLLAGAGAAALASMRPTLAPLGILILIHLAIAGVRHKRRLPLLTFIIGGALLTTLITTYTTLLTGHFHVSAYNHWMPDFHKWGSDWALLFRPDPVLENTHRADIMIRDFMGWHLSLHPAGTVSGVLLFIGALVHLAAWTRGYGMIRSTNTPRQSEAILNTMMPLLMIFLLSQIILHIAYRSWDMRFFVLMYSLFLVIGIAGVERLVRGIRSSFPDYHLVYLALALSLTILVTGSYRFPLINIAIADATHHGIPPERRDEFVRIHEFFAPMMKRYDGPVFVDRLPVLNARLLLDLDLKSHPRPVSQIDRVDDLFWDGHTVQFYFFQVHPPNDFLDPGAPWRSPPHQSWLVDIQRSEVNEDYFMELMRHYRRMTFYLNIYREHHIEPLVQLAAENGFDIEWRLEHKQWVMIVLSRNIK